MKELYKMKPIQFQKITWEKIRDVFYTPTPELKYKYLGYMCNPYPERSGANKLVWDFVKLVDAKAKRWWTPRWFLRLLHLLGNDNSIVRMRNYRLHKLHQWLTKGYLIRDMKTKWDITDLRIYGSFDDECYAYLDQIIVTIKLLLKEGTNHE